MEKITLFLGLFIALFLIYSYVKYRKTIEKTVSQEKKHDVVLPVEEKEEKYEQHVIAAVISVLMEGKKYKIRNIFLGKEEKNIKSEWKNSGRYYNMQRRDRV